MIDVISWTDGEDLGMGNTQAHRAANILSVQLGALEYAPTLGIDLNYFLTEEIKFQDESFKSYLVQKLAESGINVSNFIELLEDLISDYNINLSPEESSTGFVAR